MKKKEKIKKKKNTTLRIHQMKVTTSLASSSSGHLAYSLCIPFFDSTVARHILDLVLYLILCIWEPLILSHTAIVYQ